MKKRRRKRKRKKEKEKRRRKKKKRKGEFMSAFLAMKMDDKTACCEI